MKDKKREAKNSVMLNDTQLLQTDVSDYLPLRRPILYNAFEI
jgi:hypothetical protein